MYALHALAWPEAEERGLDEAEAAEFVRRCEVVLAGVHRFHHPHVTALASAHGERRIERFVGDAGLEVARASRPGGLSASGFGDVYLGPIVRVGLLSPNRPPRRGERSRLDQLRTGLGDILEWADRDTIPIEDLEAAAHLCLCAGPTSADGGVVREVLFETVEEGRVEDRYRQLTCHMLLEAIGGAPTADVDARFRGHWGFGGPLGDPAAGDVAFVACGWRAAILRNYSVAAWRALWRWLTEQLLDRPMTVEELGSRLAEALGELSVADVLESLPERAQGDELLPAEVEVANDLPDPLAAIRLLALGALRLTDLEGPTRAMFIGEEERDLGPLWVAGRFEEWGPRKLAGLAQEITEMLVNRAKRVALGKMRLLDGRPWVPSRLRDRDGLLSIRGEEGAGDVSLRTHSLAEILAGVGALRRDETGAMGLTIVGEELRDRIG